MTDRVELSYLVELAMQDSNRSHMRPVIEKELLHYDILYALDQANLLDTLTFQGGTALRLCYGLERFSEYLDFSGGKEFASIQLKEMKSCLEDYLGKRYGLEVIVKEPKEMREDPIHAEIKIDKWQVNVTTAPARSDIPRQKIKLEIANIPSYSRNPRPLLHNYDFLPDVYQDTLVLTESLDEIMADKFISFVNTERYIRYRDIWDLRWLKQKGAEINFDYIQRKITDYQVSDYKSKLEKLARELTHIVSSKDFFNEISRFIPLEIQERSLRKEKFLHFLADEIKNLLTEVKNGI